MAAETENKSLPDSTIKYITLLKSKIIKTDSLLKQFNDKLLEIKRKDEKIDALEKDNQKLSMQNNESHESQEKLQKQLTEHKIKLDEKSSHIGQLQFKLTDLDMENDKLKETIKKMKAVKVMNTKPPAQKKHAAIQTIAVTKPVLVNKSVNTVNSDTRKVYEKAVNTIIQNESYCDKCRGCNSVSKKLEKSISTQPLHTSHSKLPHLDMEKIESELNSPNYKESFEESNSSSLNENSNAQSFSFMEVNKFSRIVKKLKKENKKLSAKNKRLIKVGRKKISRNERDINIKKLNFKIINNYNENKSARQEKKKYKTKQQSKKPKKSQNTLMEKNYFNNSWTVGQSDNRLKRKTSVHSSDKPLEKKRKIVTENTTVTKNNIVPEDTTVNKDNILNSIIVSDLNLSEDDDISPNETLNTEINFNSNDELVRYDSKSVSKTVHCKGDEICYKNNRSTILSKNLFKTQDTSTKIRPIQKNILQSCSIRNDHNLQTLTTIKDTKSLDSITSSDLKSNSIHNSTKKKTENLFNNDETGSTFNNKFSQSNTSPNLEKLYETSSPLKTIKPVENVTTIFSDIQSSSQVTCNLGKEVKSNHQENLSSNEKNMIEPYNSAADNQNKINEDSNPYNPLRGKNKLKQTVIDIFGEDIEDLSDNDNVSKENQTISKVTNSKKNSYDETKGEKIQDYAAEDSMSSQSTESSEDSSHLSEDSDSSKDSPSSDEEDNEVSYQSNATQNDNVQNIEASCFSNGQDINKVEDNKFNIFSNETLNKNTEKIVTNKMLSDIEHASVLDVETNCSLSSSDDSNSSTEIESNSNQVPNSIETKTKNLGLNAKRKKLLFKIRNIKNITKKLPIKTSVPKTTLTALHSSSASFMNVNDSVIIPKKKRIAHTPKTSPKLVDILDKSTVASTPKPSNFQNFQESSKTQQIEVKPKLKKEISTKSAVISAEEAPKTSLDEDKPSEENEKNTKESILNLSEKKKTEIESIKLINKFEKSAGINTSNAQEKMLDSDTESEEDEIRLKKLKNTANEVDQNKSEDILENSTALSSSKASETALDEDTRSEKNEINPKVSMEDSIENKQLENDSINSENTSEISAKINTSNAIEKFFDSDSESEEDEMRLENSINDQSENKAIEVNQNESGDILKNSTALSSSKASETALDEDTRSEENEINSEESIEDSIENKQLENDSINSENTSEISAKINTSNAIEKFFDSDSESEEDEMRLENSINDQSENKAIKVNQNESGDILKNSTALSSSKPSVTALDKDTRSKENEINSEESIEDSIENIEPKNYSINSKNTSEISAEINTPGALAEISDSDTESEEDEIKIKKSKNDGGDIKSKSATTDLNKSISSEEEIYVKESIQDSLKKKKFENEPIKSDGSLQRSADFVTTKSSKTNSDEICYNESIQDIIKKEPIEQISSSSKYELNISHIHVQSEGNKQLSQKSTLKQPKRRKVSNAKNSFKIEEEFKNSFVSETKQLEDNPNTLQESIHDKLEKSIMLDIDGNVKSEKNSGVPQKRTEDILNQTVTATDNDIVHSSLKKTKNIGLKKCPSNIKSESPNVDCSLGRELRSRQLISYTEINLYHNNGSENNKSDTSEVRSLEQLKNTNAINEENTSLQSSFVLKCLNECLVAPVEGLKVQKNNIHYGIVRKQKKFVDEEIYSLMEAEEWNSEINDRVCKNLVKFNDWKMIAFVIIEHAAYKFSDDEGLDKTHTPPAPLMTPSEQKLVTLIVSIEKHNPDFGKLVIEALQFKLFRLQPAQEVSLVERLFRILIVLCRIKRDREKVRMFLLDALYSLNMRAVNGIYVALISWSELIPKYGSNNDIFVKTLVHTIMSMNPKRLFPKLTTLKNLLSMFYEYPNSDYDDSKFKEELIEHLLKGTPGASTAILIFCKKKGTEWTVKNIVNRLKLMIVTKVHPSPSVILTLLGNILRTFPTTDKENDVKDIIDQLCDVFEATEDDDLKEGIVSCLLSISKFNYNKIVRVIIQWQPKEELSPSLIEKFIATFKKHDLKWWLKFLCTHFPRKKIKKEKNCNSRKSTI